MFSPRSLIASVLTFGSWFHFELIFMCSQIGVQVYFFCVLITSFPTMICWRHYPFPIVKSWHPCLYMHVGFFLGSLSFSFGLYACVYVEPYYFNYCSFVIIGSQKVWCLQLCSSFSSGLFGLFQVLSFIQILGIFFYF